MPVLAFGGQACSLMGAGMSTLKYAQEGMVGSSSQRQLLVELLYHYHDDLQY